MPNGNSDFDRKVQDEWFEPISDVIITFANTHNLLLDKYYHEFPKWSLRFNHPNGGQASVAIFNHAPNRARICSIWHLDNYDEYTRYIHRRKECDVSKDPIQIYGALQKEFHGILNTAVGNWNKVATGYEKIWGKHTKEQFEAMGPHYPDPVNHDKGT